jgi:phosphoribosylformylglycinamidine (FGAM) synthase-like amidotransferase family enzyme
MYLPSSRIPAKRLVVLLTLMSLLVLSVPRTCSSQPTVLSDNRDFQGIKIAIYISAPGTQANGSSTALVNMFRWMNASVDLTNKSHIKAGGLTGYDILVMPGGSTFQYVAELGQDGEQKVKDFVSSGGSYFGVCGGARFACDEALVLFNGSYVTPVPNLSTGIFMIELTLNKTSGITGLSQEPDTFSTLFWGSAYFNLHNSVGVKPVAFYPNSSLAAMIALGYGQGSVFLSSPHPEYEEDSNRDGTSAFDYLNDTDSEWGIMQDIANWLIDTSAGGGTTTMLLYGSVVAVVATASVILIIIAKRR